MDKDGATRLATEYLGWEKHDQRDKPKSAPAAAVGERIIVRQRPPKTMVGRLHVPDTAQHRPFEGEIIGAGDQAADALYDQGVEWGDYIWFGKYAGVIESWEHLIHEGDDPKCAHDWAHLKVDVDDANARRCDHCGAVKVVEPMAVMNHKDIVADVDLQVRFEKGEVIRKRGETAAGATRYYTERVTESDRTTWDIDNTIKTGKARKVA